MKKTLLDFPALLAEWDAEKNAPLTPARVPMGSHQKVWWRCARGHGWQTAVYTRTAGSGCPYCAGRLAWPGENDLTSRRPALAAQWDAEKNAPLTPDRIPAGSSRKVWWRCAAGHTWQAAVKSRAAGAGCPYCAGRRISGNDLASRHPALAAQWDFGKNAPLTPAGVTPGTNRRVWWRCEKGHSWRAAVSARVRGTDCPVCAGRVILAGENDLARCFPAVAAQWHPEKNGALTPADCAPSSNRKVWWRCARGHAYQAAVSARTVHGAGCPYCAGRRVLRGFNDLQTLEPKVAAQWHPTLNGALTPEQITAGSARKVWWQCPLGHVWKAVVYSRTGPQKCGCPVCAGRVKTPRQREDLAVR